jgi:hypothetical protein
MKKLIEKSIFERKFPDLVHKLKNGKGENLTQDDVDPKELEMGIAVEMEHTDDESVSQEIAMDHLSELPDYYKHLIGKGIADEKEAIALFHKFYPDMEIEELEIKECVVKPFMKKLNEDVSREDMFLINGSDLFFFNSSLDNKIKLDIVKWYKNLTDKYREFVDILRNEITDEEDYYAQKA